MELNTAIKAIEDKLEKLKLVRTSAQFNNWQNSTTLTLINIYSESDKRIESFEKIKAFADYTVSEIDRTHEAIVDSTDLLENLVKDLKDFGIPKNKSQAKSNSKINVHVNQLNSQNQSTIVVVPLDFLVEILKDELKGGQVKELKAIIESDEPANEKKKSFVDKINSFGSDVASNILANLLTNPQVYEKLFKLI